jgi:hypothetical protein
MASSSTFPPLGAVAAGARNDEHDDAPLPDETTSLLRSTSLARKRRRRSTGFPGFAARPVRPKKRSAHSYSQSQDAVGGFWKMRWWRQGRDGGDGAKGGPSSPLLGGGHKNADQGPGDGGGPSSESNR